MRCDCGRAIPDELIDKTRAGVIEALVCSKARGGCGRRQDRRFFDERVSLADARDQLHVKLDAGARCPCCDQYSKRYRRKLSSGIARWMIALERLHQIGLEWVHVSWIAAVVGGTLPSTAKALPIGQSPIGTGDYAKARYWGLIEDRPSSTASKKDSGYWKITEKGRLFVTTGTVLASHVILYNNECQGFDGDPISIRDALGSRFDYAELMSS